MSSSILARTSSSLATTTTPRYSIPELAQTPSIVAGVRSERMPASRKVHACMFCGERQRWRRQRSLRTRAVEVASTFGIRRPSACDGNSPPRVDRLGRDTVRMTMGLQWLRQCCGVGQMGVNWRHSGQRVFAQSVKEAFDQWPALSQGDKASGHNNPKPKPFLRTPRGERKKNSVRCSGALRLAVVVYRDA